MSKNVSLDQFLDTSLKDSTKTISSLATSIESLERTIYPLGDLLSTITKEKREMLTTVSTINDILTEFKSHIKQIQRIPLVLNNITSSLSTFSTTISQLTNTVTSYKYITTNLVAKLSQMDTTFNIISNQIPVIEELSQLQNIIQDTFTSLSQNERIELKKTIQNTTSSVINSDDVILTQLHQTPVDVTKQSNNVYYQDNLKTSDIQYLEESESSYKAKNVKKNSQASNDSEDIAQAVAIFICGTYN